jgi:regulatory protein
MDQDHEYLLTKIRGFCAFQERCIHDVTEKLNEWKVGQKHIEKIIDQLIKEDYLNEERFAKSYAGGKFRINHWGKTKIIYELGKRQVPDLIIQIGLQEIDDDEYEGTLKEILLRKSREIREKDPYKKRQKLITHAAQKGYDYNLIKHVIEKIQQSAR